MKRIHLSSAVILATVLLTTVIIAAGADTIGYQGRLTDAGGQPVDGQVNITFAIYDSDTATSNLWAETQTGVTVSAGIFNVRLGEVVAISPNIFDGPDRWLGIKVWG